MSNGWQGPLRSAMPRLIERLDPLPLARLPSPVIRLSLLGQRLRHAGLYLKCDHDSSPLYGGNKVRKLEFLLAEAQRRRARTLVTIGGIGSNHVLATALHGRALGLATVGVVFPQPDNPWVERNQAAGQGAGLELVRASSRWSFPWLVGRTFRQKSRELPGKVYFVPGGGSSPLGALGFVNAGLELADQVRAGLLPEPEWVFVATGTGGTAAGLALGLGLGGLQTRVRAVRVVERFLATRTLLGWLDRGMRRLARDPGGEEINRRKRSCRIELEHGYFGPGYGCATEAGKKSVELFAEEGIALETTYTGKAAAAFLDEARRNPKPLLFWNTYSAADLSPWIFKLGPG